MHLLKLNCSTLCTLPTQDPRRMGEEEKKIHKELQNHYIPACQMTRVQCLLTHGPSIKSLSNHITS